MKNLKNIRKHLNVSRRRLAEDLGLPKDELKAWEKGEYLPDRKTARDIAVYFGVGVDLLKGEPGAIEQTDLRYIEDENSPESKSISLSGYWGNLGLKLKDEKYTRWYPIASETAKTLEEVMMDGNEYYDDLIKLTTLNNRLLVFRVSEIERIILLHDDLDEPSDDWNVSFDTIEGLGIEVYRGLRHRLDHMRIITSYNFDLEESERLKSYIDDLMEIVNRKNIGKSHLVIENHFSDLLEKTHIKLTSGKTYSCTMSDNSLLDVVDCAVYGISDYPNPGILKVLSDEFVSFYNWQDVVIIDAPLIQYVDAVSTARDN